jgi:hypothetical protein
MEIVFCRVYEYPGVRVVSREILIQILWHFVVELVGLLEVGQAEPIMGSMSMYFAVDAEVFFRVFVFEATFFGEVSAATSVADVCNLLAAGSDMSSIDGMAFEATMRFG